MSGLNEAATSIRAVAECPPESGSSASGRLAVARDFEVTIHDMPSGTLVRRQHMSYAAGAGRALLACAPGGKDVALIVTDALAFTD